MISVTPRARRNQDHAGDPLDGLVNLFDVGIVLAVAFLLAALSSRGLTSTLTSGSGKSDSSNAVTVSPDQKTGEIPDSTGRVVGHGAKVGTVYRLKDGRLIYVTGTSTATATPAPSGE